MIKMSQRHPKRCSKKNDNRVPQLFQIIKFIANFILDHPLINIFKQDMILMKVSIVLMIILELKNSNW